MRKFFWGITVKVLRGELMKFDRSLPLKERIAKRRRKKRIRFFTMLAAVFIVASGLYGDIPAKSLVYKLNGLLANLRDDAGQALEGVGSDSGHRVDSGIKIDYGGINDDENRVDGSGIKSRGRIDAVASGRNKERTDRDEVKDLSVLKSDIESYIKKFSGEYGIYYINLVDGSEFGINETTEYIAASTIKIPINLYLYKKIEAGSVNGDGLMTYLQSDYEGGTGKLQYEKVGSRYTVKELSRLSIEVSDNVATNILLRLLGRNNVKDYMRELGGTVVSDADNVSCPKDMALYMKRVYEFYQSNDSLGKELMNYFENTIFNDRIPKLLPKDVRVAHKIGNQVGAYHDVGVVFSDEPYVISIMSRNVDDETEACEVIANISKKVYDFVTGKK